MKYSYLLEAWEGKYHILPPEKTSQDYNMRAVKAASKLQCKTVPQKDGSKFKIIYTKKFLAPDIISKLYEMMPGINTILPETKLSNEELYDMLLQQDYIIGYKTHVFIDSVRIIPIIPDIQRLTFYNASPLFNENQPEDDLGILVESEENFMHLTNTLTTNVKVIEYLSHKRLCPCCGVVSDHSKNRRQAWVYSK